MEELSKKVYWDSRHSEYDHACSHQNDRGLKRLLRRLAPNAPWEQSVGERRRWAICDRYLPQDGNLRVVEIGCAPGKILLSYHKRYGYQPWGIEYSHVGVMKSREVFVSSGLNPNYIVEADFFSEDITEKFGGFFDVVTSHGFIEHFDEPAHVVRRHVSLLRPGGFLVVVIPNLRGFNYLRVRTACPEKIAIHNFDIMKRSAFHSLFKDPELWLEDLFVGYVGTLTLRHLFPDWLPDFESIIDKILWLFVGDRGFETAFFSPHLMYIGKRVL